ncbi:MAG: GntR family transcriptional regulator [Bacteroidetes bacterium]|nr:MAG: GntR family transcriptional regulator [Bacteroidota bacterium]
MLKLGQLNTLKASRQTDNGIYLIDDESDEVLLPNKYVPDELEIDDKIEVFLYKDSEDLIIATTLLPKVMLNGYAPLVAKAVGTFGAFFDWGLEKDLLVPYRLQAKHIEEGKAYVVYLFLDEVSQRLVGSTKINNTFKKEPQDLQIGDKVSLLPYALSEIGISVIVNNSYQGMLFSNEVFEKVKIGKALNGYVKNIRADKKIDVSLNRSGYIAVDDNVQKLHDALVDNGGELNLTDKSAPSEIVDQLGMSKKIFKKAVGALYKQRKLEIGETSIKLVDNKV